MSSKLAAPLLVLAAFVFPLGGACNGDADEPTNVDVGIGPAGGVVRVEGLELEVPKGALTRTTVIEIAPARSLPPARGWKMVKAFELSPSGLVFEIPATARAAYAEGEGEPRLFMSSDGNSDWSALASSRYDARAELVTGSVAHFSFLSLQVAVTEGGAGGASGGDAGLGPGGARPAEGGGGGFSPVGGQAGFAGDGGQRGSELGGQSGGGEAMVGGEAGQAATGEVTCASASGLGPDPCEAGELSCVHGGLALSTETNWESCSDGHSYTIRCSGSGTTCSCSCLVDSVQKGSCSYAMQACDGPAFGRCACDVFPKLTFKP